ncbi:hypothetical protein BO71DRAFT_451826 [Aspergillus ellipticus CBS 707.79]|uniref:Uncharacterized protein n=1 Tax=Aspergillus ellipticus CBS 707.79 TaxID=1448320 RepID=A0A319ELP1_9EURO|nr:hypothetical protein BO71DRAFT_451826 [Aspergillus ellipticus CBS 707.79]
MSKSPSPNDSETPHSQSGTSRAHHDKRRRVRHNKSRKGCFTCNFVTSRARSRRMVDPLQPLDFHLEGPTVETPLRDQAVNMADMRLLTKYMRHTSKKMALHSKRSRIWEQVIPEMAAEQEYLMYILLALTGEHVLHEAYTSRSNTTVGSGGIQSALHPHDDHAIQLEYHRLIQHHQNGLEGFCQALADMSPATADYVFCGSLLIVAIAFASLSVRNYNNLTGPGLGAEIDHHDPYIDWLHLVRGLTSVVQEHWLTLKAGRLRTMLYYTYAHDNWKPAKSALLSAHFPRLMNASQTLIVFAQGACQSLNMLRAFTATLPLTTTTPHSETKPHDGSSTCTSYHSNDEHVYDHANTINRLEEIYMRILYALQFSQSEHDYPTSLDIQIDLEESALTSWPQMLSTTFIASLVPTSTAEQLATADAFSYSILAHFYLVFLLFENTWYLSRGFRSEIERICWHVKRVDNEGLNALMVWPMAVLAES